MESGSEESYTYEDSDEDIAADIANIDELTESELQKIIEKLVYYQETDKVLREPLTKIGALKRSLTETMNLRNSARTLRVLRMSAMKTRTAYRSRNRPR